MFLSFWILLVISIFWLPQLIALHIKIDMVLALRMPSILPYSIFANPQVNIDLTNSNSTIAIARSHCFLRNKKTQLLFPSSHCLLLFIIIPVYSF